MEGDEEGYGKDRISYVISFGKGFTRRDLLIRCDWLWVHSPIYVKMSQRHMGCVLPKGSNHAGKLGSSSRYRKRSDEAALQQQQEGIQNIILRCTKYSE